jgi:1-deoxy-D-xylulose-5-phosphate synthase
VRNSVKEAVKSMLLSQINDPGDLKKLSVEQLPMLAEEIRQFLI